MTADDTADQELSLLPRPPWPAYPHSDPLHHVVYEFDMLWFTLGWLDTLNGQPRSPATQLVENAVLESFAIHVRNIIEFAYDKYVSSRQYIKARDLVADPMKWASARDHSPLRHKAAYIRAANT